MLYRELELSEIDELDRNDKLACTLCEERGMTDVPYFESILNHDLICINCFNKLLVKYGKMKQE